MKPEAAPKSPQPIQRAFVAAALAIAIIGPSPVRAAQTGTPSLAWDATAKSHTLAAGETSARFTFIVTNLASAEVVVQRVTTSCGCTAAQLPAQPWRLAPGERGELKFTMDLRGRSGSIAKTGTVFTSAGLSILTMTATVPGGLGPPAEQRILPVPGQIASASSAARPSRPAPGAILPATAERARNQSLALADHQAVFRGDCARCHAEPAKGKLGEELYTAACGICHDAEHRAQMVPELGASEQAGNPAYWRSWITFGKPGSLMPAFAEHYGGPLDREQIESLAAFLSKKHAPIAK